MTGRNIPKSSFDAPTDAHLKLKIDLLERLIADAEHGRNGLHHYEGVILKGILGALLAFNSKTMEGN